jgi:hypothetical protein
VNPDGTTGPDSGPAAGASVHCADLSLALDQQLRFTSSAGGFGLALCGTRGVPEADHRGTAHVSSAQVGGNEHTFRKSEVTCAALACQHQHRSQPVSRTARHHDGILPRGHPLVAQMKGRAVAAQNTANSIRSTTTVRSLGHRPRDAIRDREPYCHRRRLPARD